MVEESAPLSRKLERIYYDPSSPGGYRGPEALWKVAKIHIPRLKKKHVYDFIKKQQAYTKHKQFRPVQRYRKVFTKRAFYLVQMDLLDFQRWSSENDDFNYVCCAIDTFTKKLWTFPLVTKTGQELYNALFFFLTENRPEKVQVDQGTEFFNKRFKGLLHQLGIKMYNTWSIKKASIVERVQRTLRNRLGKIWERNGDHRWIDIFPQITKSYNNSVHRTIGMKPNDVRPEHRELILKRLYFPKQSPHKVKRENEINRWKIKQIKIGDHVRLLEYRTKFRKESDLAWTNEVFRVRRVVQTKPVTFLIEDLNAEPIKGGFYFEELIKVTPSNTELNVQNRSSVTERGIDYLENRNQEIRDLSTAREIWEGNRDTVNVRDRRNIRNTRSRRE